jgi:oligoendopeptidase F
MITLLPPFGPPESGAGSTGTRARDQVPEEDTWNLADIFDGWPAWEASLAEFQSSVDAFAQLRGTLAEGPGSLLRAYGLSDQLGQLAYRLWYYAALSYDEDQRQNAANARRQQMQIQLARWRQAASWFSPELLRLPLDTVRGWMASDRELAVYRFAIEDLYRQQEHVLDEQGERLLSLGDRFNSAPHDAYSSLSTADMKPPTVTVSDGRSVTLTYGQYRALLATNRHQPDRALAFRAFHEAFQANANTYAALYNAVLQRDWYLAQARGYRTTLEAALHESNIPVSVYENLIETTKSGSAALRRYHRLRKRVLGLDTYHAYDWLVPLVDFERTFRYRDVLADITESVGPLGPDYQRQMRDAFGGRWIDVYENAGKRSGAYSAPVYGVHPYMLLNYNDTLEAVFTLAHEMGHSMHTMLADAHQPFVYSGYSIFVAEVASTLSEALFLDHRLARTKDERERVVLLQHAIDDIAGTFYTQVLFADFELQAHRLVEQGQPITADALGDVYFALLEAYHGDSLDCDELSRITWARIPHFYATPYYVYQYATCYASTAQLISGITSGPEAGRRAAVERYLALLQAGGSDHPMALLERAGVDLRKPEAVRSVGQQLDRRVSQLEEEIDRLGKAGA